MSNNDSQITATLSEREWVKVRELLQYAIDDLDDRDLEKTVAAKRELYDKIEDQTRSDDPDTLAEIVEFSSKELDIGKSFEVEETSRQNAHLRD